MPTRMSHAEQQAVHFHLRKALQAERERQLAEANCEQAQADLWARVAAFWWTAAEYAPITSEDVEGARDDNRLPKRFLALATGDSAAILKTEWGTFHRFTMGAVLNILSWRVLPVALIACLGGLKPHEIGAELKLKEKDVVELILVACGQLATLANGTPQTIHKGRLKQVTTTRKVVVEPQPRMVYGRLRGRITSALARGPLTTSQLAAVVGRTNDAITGSLIRLANKGFIVGNLPHRENGRPRPNTTWTLVESSVHLEQKGA